MKKLFFIVALFLLQLASPVSAIAGNMGINVAANHQDLDRAAEIVGNGGWIVIMACPGDGDTIANFVNKYPNINLVIRGHFPGNTPDEKLAKSWAATLSSITDKDKNNNVSRIYFMPWNEPNQNGSDDYTSQDNLIKYTNALVNELNATGVRGRGVYLLSPMVNYTHPNFSEYVKVLKDKNYFAQFDGIAINLYDLCTDVLNCDSRYQNPLKVNEILNEMGVPGKQVYGVESGTAGGTNWYYLSPPSTGSPLYRFVSRFKRETSAKMFAIPSYDLGGEAGHNWSLFSDDGVISLLRGGGGGAEKSSYSGFTTTMNKCTGKSHTYYSSNEGECTGCGGGFSLLECKPNPVDNFGEEYSKETIKLTEKVFPENYCTTKEFTGEIKVTDAKIPFIQELTDYFLGPYADRLNERAAKPKKDPINDYGVLEKLTPKEYQDQLRLQFLDEITKNPDTRYKDFKVQGMGATDLANKFKAIRDKQKSLEVLTASENSFLTSVWPRIPLIANEESKGEIVLEGTGINGKVNTSVPGVYRLDKAITIIAKIFNAGSDSVQGAKTESQNVLAVVDNACETLPVVDKKVNTKETLSGQNLNVCTKDLIQDEVTNFVGERTYDRSVFEGKDMGGCDEQFVDGCCEIGKRCEANGEVAESRLCKDSGGCTCRECIGTTTCWGEGDHRSACLVPKNDKTYEVDINIKNKVPFLQRIAENTVEKMGFFRNFIPYYLQSGTTPSVIKKTFSEVAGISTANIEINNIKETIPSIEVDPEKIQSPITLLFYKLGTLLNVTRFVSGVELWPYRPGGSSGQPDKEKECTNLEFTGNVLGASEIPPAIKQKVISEVKASDNWGSRTKIESQWDYVYNQAINHGWNPAFVIALWIEESGASGVPNIDKTYDLGCTAGEKNNLSSQLQCLFNIKYADKSFYEFMCMYSEGTSSPCKFCLNQNFPGNLKYWYNQLTN